MSGTELPKQPASGTGNPQYHFANLDADFARSLVADLSGLGEAFDKGDVDQFGFLQFCLKHLGKIDKYIEFKNKKVDK